MQISFSCGVEMIKCIEIHLSYNKNMEINRYSFRSNMMIHYLSESSFVARLMMIVSHRQYNEFLEDLEEDEILRKNVNIFRGDEPRQP